MNEYEKDPDAKRLYTWNLVDYLADRPGATPVTITSAAVLPVDGLSITQVTFDATTVTAMIGGGDVGALYTVTARLSLSNGEQDDRSIVLYITET